ncbi:MAG: pyridoxamine 5'-phosphate oxidase [Sphingobacteriales bacterium]|nr:pyridoxamine 5'-phosphate oxidase [Sphingobacteriales bacterium]
MNTIADIRKEYKLRTLDESDIAADPIQQFGKWWDEAVNSTIEEVNAMTLATVNSAGRPSARIVLLKGFDKSGFTFFTNYKSHKGIDIQENPNVGLVFFWKELERQVRVEGIAQKLSQVESDTYFNSRPEGSKIGAWASPQSKVIVTREEIEENVKKYQEEFPYGGITRPPHWGGYNVQPQLIEFWQGRPSRLHDRIQYSLQEGIWVKERLAP